MLEKKEFILEWDSNKVSLKEIKKWVKKFSKPVSIALFSSLSINQPISSNELDISKLPHYASNCKSYFNNFVKVCTDWDSHYNTDYYERYNTRVQNLESTNLKGIEHLNIINAKLYFYDHTYHLVSTQEIFPSESDFKSEDLDKVIININWVSFKARPKFLKLTFSRWSNNYMIKSLTLVYVPYLDKIKVLWVVDAIAGFIETKPRDYEVVSSIDQKRKVYYYISKLLWCNNCRYKKSFSGDTYFYSNWKLVWVVQDMWDKKFILSNNHLVWKLIENRKKVILLDRNDRVVFRSSWFKRINVQIPEINARIDLVLNN